MLRVMPSALVLCLASFTPAFAQTAPATQAVIETGGEAVVRRPADVAWVEIAVDGRAAKSDEARQRAGESMTSVMSALKETLHADAIKTSAYSLRPEMEQVNGASRLKGYVAHVGVTVRVDDLDRMASLIDQATASGATSVGNIRFDVKTRAAAEREALGLAVKEAMDRARAIALGIGQSLGPIVRVRDDRALSAGAGQFAWNLEGGSIPESSNVGPGTPLTPGDVEIKARVVLTVAIR